MRILHVLGTPRAEGTPNLVLDWLMTGMHEQDVFVLHADPQDMAADLKSAARWYDESRLLDLNRSKKFTGIAKAVREVSAVRKPDLVICWTAGFGNWVCLGARMAGVRRLLVHCGNRPNRGFWPDWITRYIMWPLALLGARCVCCSSYLRDEHRAIPLVPKKLFFVVYNCTRAEEVSARAQQAQKRRPVSPSAIGIMVANMEVHKDGRPVRNHAALLRAMIHIQKKLPDFRLRLVGDGRLRLDLEALARKLRIDGNVEFLGARRDVPELLGLADVFVFSTTPEEGLGSALLEAMAAGLPIVATDVPACRELLADGRYGVLVHPNDPEALAQAIIGVLAAKPDVAPGEVYARSFTPQRMIDGYVKSF
jgi:glycosyltransferase involved in cell wall biosynthesis